MRHKSFLARYQFDSTGSVGQGIHIHMWRPCMPVRHWKLKSCLGDQLTMRSRTPVDSAEGTLFLFRGIRI